MPDWFAAIPAAYLVAVIVLVLFYGFAWALCRAAAIGDRALERR